PGAEERSDDAPPPLGSVSIRARNESGRIVIDVVDTGPGLPAQALERLFEPFQGSQKPGGSGLGVAIAYEILRAHGGTLVLTKTDKTGATFTLALPN
ncbi:MAG: ATP-binding protein, partial [Parvularculaceae bacterium]|nr:ATP-binding protein [Parvularculaceae bacterium]